jgi:hypothetical protein
VKKTFKNDEEVYDSIAKMLLNLGDKYTRYLPPAKYDILMNSAQGELLLGIQLGQWFQSKGVEAIVTEGQVCESACALAYLGAQRKQVQANGRVVMHLSGEQGKGFDCARSVDMMPLRNYLLSIAGKQSGQALYNQALTYCRNGQGWNLS